MQSSERRPHAVLDLESRRLKALKIENLLGLNPKKQPIRLLEVGTGSGGIAYYFGNHDTLNCKVCAVDVVDQRLLEEGFDFSLVEDTHLPFPENSFDIVLSNHVIEHVGGSQAQYHHLSEIHRVLRLDGIGYLAVPNRWMLVEPHYKLIFLSWLPEFIRSYYLRLFRKGTYYDCRPLTMNKLEKLLEDSGFQFKNICTEALRETLTIEKNHGKLANAACMLPDWLLDRLAVVNPTLIYKITLRTEVKIP